MFLTKVCTTFYPQGISDCVLLSRTERNGVKRVFSLSRAFLRARERRTVVGVASPAKALKGLMSRVLTLPSDVWLESRVRDSHRPVDRHRCKLFVCVILIVPPKTSKPVRLWSLLVSPEGKRKTYFLVTVWAYPLKNTYTLQCKCKELIVESSIFTSLSRFFPTGTINCK